MSANKQKHQPLLYIAQPEIKPPAVAMQSKYSIKKEKKNASQQPKEPIAATLEDQQPESSSASAVQPALQGEKAENRTSEEQSYEPFSTLRKAASFRRVKHFKELNLEEKLEYLLNIPVQLAPVSCLFITSENKYTGKLQHNFEEHIEILPRAGPPISIEKQKLSDIQLLGFR